MSKCIKVPRKTQRYNRPYDVLVDTTHLSCPMPLLKVKAALNHYQSGQILRIDTCDAGAWRDIPVYIAATEHHLLCKISEKNSYSFWVEV